MMETTTLRALRGLRGLRDKISRPVLRPELRPGEVTLVVVSLVVLAYLTIDVIAGGLITQLDQTIFDNWSHHHSPDYVFVNRWGSADLEVPVLVIALLVSSHALRRWWPLMLTAANSAAAAVVVLGMKEAIGRPGPGRYAARSGYPGYFPSGHAATAAICLGTAAFLLWSLSTRACRWVQPATVGLVVGLGGATVVSVSVVASGHHWASDVVASLAICTIILVFGFAICRATVGRLPGARPGLGPDKAA